MSSKTTSIADRINVSETVIGHPHNFHESQRHKLDVHEGEHYSVIAHTDWADMFYPTVIQWISGEFDSFDDLEASQRNKEHAKRVIEAERQGWMFGRID